MSADEVHRATLCILAFSTAHVMTVEELNHASPHRLLVRRGRKPHRRIQDASRAQYLRSVKPPRTPRRLIATLANGWFAFS